MKPNETLLSTQLIDEPLSQVLVDAMGDDHVGNSLVDTRMRDDAFEMDDNSWFRFDR